MDSDKSFIHVKTWALECCLHNCGDVSPDEETRTLHIIESHRIFAYPCIAPNCFTGFNSRLDLDVHLASNHANQPAKTVKGEAKTDFQPPRCLRCITQSSSEFASYFASYEDLQLHMQIVHELGIFQCRRVEACQFTAASRQDIFAHIKTVHSDVPEDLPPVLDVSNPLKENKTFTRSLARMVNCKTHQKGDLFRKMPSQDWSANTSAPNNSGIVIDYPGDWSEFVKKRKSRNGRVYSGFPGNSSLEETIIKDQEFQQKRSRGRKRQATASSRKKLASGDIRPPSFGNSQENDSSDELGNGEDSNDEDYYEYRVEKQRQSTGKSVAASVKPKTTMIEWSCIIGGCEKWFHTKEELVDHQRNDPHPLRTSFIQAKANSEANRPASLTIFEGSQVYQTEAPTTHNQVDLNSLPMIQVDHSNESTNATPTMSACDLFNAMQSESSSTQMPRVSQYVILQASGSETLSPNIEHFTTAASNKPRKIVIIRQNSQKESDAAQMLQSLMNSGTAATPSEDTLTTTIEPSDDLLGQALNDAGIVEDGGEQQFIEQINA